MRSFPPLKGERSLSSEKTILSQKEDSFTYLLVKSSFTLQPLVVIVVAELLLLLSHRPSEDIGLFRLKHEIH